MNAHLYCWNEGELTVKGKGNPDPAILCCLMPCGDTTEPRAFPGDVFYKRSNISRHNTRHEDKPHKRRAKQSTGQGEGVSTEACACPECSTCLLEEVQARGLCLLLKPRQGWAVVERFLPVLGLPHLPPQCLCPSSCDASQDEDTQARWKAVPGGAVLQQPVTAGEMLEYVKAVQSARGPWEPSGNRC